MALFYMIVPYFVLDLKKKRIFILLGLVLDSFFDLLTQVFVLLFKNKSSTVTFNTIFSAWFLICLLICLVLYYKKHFYIPKFFLEQIPNVFYILLFIVLFVISLMLEKDTETFGPLELYLSGGFVIIAFFGISYIVVKYITVSSKQREAHVQLDMQAKHYEELAEKNRDIRRFRHVIKNNLLALNILLTDEKYSEAKTYIDGLNESVKETENKFSTGSYFVDALLAHKADELASDGVEIEFSGTVSSDKLSNNDLCTILTNSIDNAARACKELAPCKIKINSDESEKGCTITVYNPVSKKVEIKNNSIKTSKKDSQNHGFGIENIKRVAEKNNGFVKLDCTENEFSIKIGLLF